MNKLALLTATLAVSGLALSTHAEDKPVFTQPPPFETARDGASAAAGTADVAKDAAAVREVFDDVVEAALTKNDYDEVLESFTKADQDRLATFQLSDEQRRTLDGRIEQIQRDWQTKYGSAFDFSAKQVFADGSFRVVPGDLSNEARMAAERRDAATAQEAADAAKAATGDRLNVVILEPGDKKASTPDANPSEAARPTTNASRTGASDAAGGDVTLNLVRSGDDYLIDLPDHVTGEQFYDHLLATLTRIGENQAQWPSDANAAYLNVSHQILGAFSGAGLASDVQSPNDATARPATPNAGHDANRPGSNNAGGDFGNRNTFGESGNNPNR